MKRLLKWVGLGIVGLLIVMLINVFLTSSLQPKIKFLGAANKDTTALARLSKAIQFKTVSYDDSSDGIEKIKELHALYQWMFQAYPLVFKYAKIDTVGYSRIITFKGTNSTLKPAIFLAHLDVVPANKSHTGDWKFEPFSGTFTKDTIYGRGVLDDKSIATAMLEAMENMLSRGVKTQRSIIFCFGHDEETGGKKGAAHIAAFLSQQNLNAEFICDEGFGVMEGLVPGIKNPVAMIGVAEKGYLTVQLSIDIAGGHSSMPKAENATSLLIRALNKLENEELNESFCQPQKDFFRTIAPEASFGYRFLFSNLWITSPAVKAVLRKNEKTAATIHTTHATTILKAGDKENSLPGHAEATVNFRILPGQSIKDVMELLTRIIDDHRIHLKMLEERTEPSPVAPSNGFAWNAISATIHECFDNVITAPAMVIAGTDCKHYVNISSNIYRFTPLRLNNSNLSGIHGSNEKLAAANYYEMINYYQKLLGKM